MNCAKAYAELAGIVGEGNAFTQDIDDYLRDETFLRGEAGLVLRPGSSSELVNIVRTAQEMRREYSGDKNDLSLTLRGGGSGLSGACVPTSGIVLDLTRMNRVLDIDEKNQTLSAECGIILSEINTALADSPFHYAVDPSSVALCTLGGSIATNAAGPSSLKYGTTRQNLAALEYVDARGQKVRAGGQPPKTSLGFSLINILCGSEGRLGVITEATIRLRPRTEESALAIGAFDSERAAMDFVILAKRLNAKCIEIIDETSATLVDFPIKVKPHSAVLMVEFDGSSAEVLRALENLMAIDVNVEWVSARDEKNRAALWARRKQITHELKKRYAFKLGEDIAVPLTVLAHTANFAREKAQFRGVDTAIWGHAGDGNLHVNYLMHRESDLNLLDTLMTELAHEVVKVGGAISGEHGLGRLKKSIARRVMPKDYFEAQEKVKTAFDPERLFNPALDT